MINKIKQNTGELFLLLCEGVLIVFALYTGISTLIGDADKNELDIVMATEAGAIEHSMDGFIPLGTDYYYFAVTKESVEDKQLYVIRASKNWLNNNFSDGFPINGESVRVKGVFKSINDDVKSEFDNIIKEMDMGYVTSKALVLNYKTVAIALIIWAVVNILFVMALFKFKLYSLDADSKIGKKLSNFITVDIISICLIMGKYFL